MECIRDGMFWNYDILHCRTYCDEFFQDVLAPLCCTLEHFVAASPLFFLLTMGLGGGTTERTFHYCWRVKSSFKLVWNWFDCHLWISSPIGYLLSGFVLRMRAYLGSEELQEQRERPERNKGYATLILFLYNIFLLYTVAMGHGCWKNVKNLWQQIFLKINISETIV